MVVTIHCDDHSFLSHLTGFMQEGSNNQTLLMLLVLLYTFCFVHNIREERQAE